MRVSQLIFNILVVLMGFSHEGHAEVLSTNFSTNSLSLTGSAVVNLVLGVTHPPLQVSQWRETASPTFQDTTIDVGTGRNGSFTQATYSQFSVNGDLTGNIITIDTDYYPELHFTNFDLQVGWTIIPTGSNPLIIRSQFDLTVSGSILCNGVVGSNSNAAIGTAALGGGGACGGGQGGSGGTNLIGGTTGTIGMTTQPVISGGVGVSVADGSGGGGGGGFNIGAYASTAGAGTSPGAAGTVRKDGGFSILGSSAGGGGGSSLAGSGAGGGGGGGVIYLIAYNDLFVAATGIVRANGGNGGAGSNLGGGGGGGAGGSIMTLAGRNLTIDGVVETLRGNGGTSISGAGGNGSAGRIWATDSIGSFGGVGLIDPSASGLNDLGVLNFKTGIFSLESASMDLSGNFAQNFLVSSIEQNSSAGSGSFELAGSKQGFGVDSTGYLSSANFTSLYQSKYLRLRINLTNTSTTTPFQLDQIQVIYSKGAQPEFNYESACGIMTSKQNHQGHPKSRQYILMTLFSLATPLLILGSLYVRFLRRRS